MKSVNLKALSFGSTWSGSLTTQKIFCNLTSEGQASQVTEEKIYQTRF